VGLVDGAGFAGVAEGDVDCAIVALATRNEATTAPYTWSFFMEPPEARAS
jgi:hypothetical protein